MRLRLRAILLLLPLLATGAFAQSLNPWEDPSCPEWVAAMQANQFPLMGATRSYWSFYMGMGLAVTICLTIISSRLL